ncbi:uncharacterized protein LOC134855623 isoform X2 [Symsagittifera roscoffensis]|uniref:uncharacterized protein LOC134855623 isoform X2 n=1 Tax=Symsagittifera roscoffensis TaxID=84072 RepID=UPI00307B3DA8
MALEASQIYPGCETFSAEFDDDGVYFYQAYNSEIADYAIEHQKLGGANYNTASANANTEAVVVLVGSSGTQHVTSGPPRDGNPEKSPDKKPFKLVSKDG